MPGKKYSLIASKTNQTWFDPCYNKGNPILTNYRDTIRCLGDYGLREWRDGAHLSG
jgi:hypothetical protein